MTDEKALNAEQDAAITRYVVMVTIPVLANGSPAPSILGTGTLFTHEDRYFIVTAAHILKTDVDDPSSADIDLTGIAYPTGRFNAQLLNWDRLSCIALRPRLASMSQSSSCRTGRRLRR
jgi:hypothetical protein